MIEDLKQLLKSNDVHIAIALVKKLYLAADRSYLKVMVSILPEERNIIATMTWDYVGPDAGDFAFPEMGDLVLIAQAEGDVDQAYVIKRLTSRTDKIPQIASNGDKVTKVLAGKKYWNISDTRINLARGEAEPTENLVLGQVFKTFASSLLSVLKDHAQNDADHTYVGNLGYPTQVPINQADYLTRKTDYDGLKNSPIDDSAILSDLTFTEK
jgi:hypothetical protein